MFNNKVVYFGVIVFTIVGLIILYFVVSDIIRQVSYINKAMSGMGEVIEIGKKSTVTGSGTSKQYSVVHYAKIRFSPSNGKQITFEHRYGLLQNHFNKGDKVKVYFDQKDPPDARVNSFLALWAGYLAILIMAISFLAGGYTVHKVFGSDIQRKQSYVKQKISNHQNASVDQTVREFLGKGRKIEAIKYIREEMNLGLDDAKKYVESIDKGMK